MLYIKLNIQRFGGRGAMSYTAKSFDGEKRKKLAFYDKTDIYGGMTSEEFGNKILNYKTEYIGVFDENGIIYKAGTSYNRSGVASPNEADGAYGTIHNHPSGNQEGKYIRTLGGAFSGEDLQSMSILGNKVMKVVAKEATYTLSAKNGTITSSNRQKLATAGTKVNSTWLNSAKNLYKQVSKKLTSQGKTMTSSTMSNISYGIGKTVVKNLVQGTGYEFTIKKNK